MTSRVNPNGLISISFFARVFSSCLLILALAVSSAAWAQTDSTPEADSEEAIAPVMVFYPTDPEQPGFISVELDPGETETIELLLGNGGDESFQATTYVADAFSMRNGGFSARELSDARTGPTLWLGYDEETMALHPGEEELRDLVISVPADTPPGEYVSSVILQTAPPLDADQDESEGQFRLNQVYRTVLGVRILVPGELKASLEIGEPSYKLAVVPSISVPVVNTGNVRTNPSGELRVFDSSGSEVILAPVNMGGIYGGHETEIWIVLGEPLPAGDYGVTVILSDDNRDVSAELPLTGFSVDGSPEATSSAELTMSFSEVSASPNPSEGAIQFLAVEATVRNTSDPVVNAQLSLVVSVNGEEFERFPISQSLALPTGDTTVSARYIPVGGWSSGVWEFELVLETVGTGGTVSVLVSETIDIQVDVP